MSALMKLHISMNIRVWCSRSNHLVVVLIISK